MLENFSINPTMNPLLLSTPNMEFFENCCRLKSLHIKVEKVHLKKLWTQQTKSHNNCNIL